MNASEPPSAAGDATPPPHRPHEHHHADVSGGWLRASVFGAMDGLVSNMSLIAGVAGAGVATRTIVLTGIAGLTAGAFSMALGEFTSVRTANEQITAELEKERAELAAHPEVEKRELIGLLQKRGLSERLAHEVADEISADPELALRVHAFEEMGVTPDGQASPWVAAVSSFISFTVGAFIPIIPYFLGQHTLWWALACGGAGLFLTGAIASRATKRTWWLAGLRQLALGGIAAGVTYAIGSAIGVGVG